MTKFPIGILSNYTYTLQHHQNISTFHELGTYDISNSSLCIISDNYTSLCE